MRLLIAASCAAPLFEGPFLLRAARSVTAHRIAAELLDLSASRDPTLALPDLARRTEADVVLVARPTRLDPVTLETVRRLGARVWAWFAAPPAAAGSRERARRRWLAGACDGVLSTPDVDFGLRDRRGRPALRLGRGAPSPVPDSRPRRDPALDFAVRAPGDPFLARLPAEPGRRRLGLGDPRLFPRGFRSERPASPEDLLNRLRSGGRLLCGARPPDRGAPTLLDEAGLARVAGLEAVSVAFLGGLESARHLADADSVPLAERLNAWLERL